MTSQVVREERVQDAITLLDARHFTDAELLEANRRVRRLRLAAGVLVPPQASQLNPSLRGILAGLTFVVLVVVGFLMATCPASAQEPCRSVDCIPDDHVMLGDEPCTTHVRRNECGYPVDMLGNAMEVRGKCIIGAMGFADVPPPPCGAPSKPGAPWWLGNQITFEWEASSGPVVAYDVDISHDDEPFHALARTTEPRLTVTLPEGIRSVRLRVQALDVDENRGPWSPESDPFRVVGGQVIMDAPTPPRNLVYGPAERAQVP